MLTSKQTVLVGAISLALGMSQQALAQTKPTQKDEQDIETLVVTANPLNRSVLQSAAPVSIITGEDLQSRIAPTLGETLKDVPGVHSTYFGPVSSSPIIRGLDGPRIKVLQNGLDVSDASRVGPDHIVSTETSNARQIEVLRGPATLLYGSGAIGGVVNVVDNRLPTFPTEGIEGNVSYLHDTVSSEDLFNVSLDGGNGEFLWHFDAFDRETEDYEIPGFAEIEPDEGEEPGTLENSFIDANGFNVGIGWATDSFNAALSFGSLESEYGIPGHAHAHEEEHGEEEHEGEEHEGEEHSEEEEVVFGQLEQDRVQALLDWKNLDGFFSEVNFRGSHTDYSHNEVEDGEIGTTFSNESLETRLWAKHRETNGWEGVIGINYINSDFEALGDEAFTPASETDSFAIFLLEEKQVGDVLYQFGARYEDTQISVDNSFFEHSDEHEEEEHEGEEEHEEEAFFFEDEDFSAVSLSAGAVWTVDANRTLSFNLAHSQRAPSATEMFSNGLHIATNTFELGAAFDIEVSEDGDEYEIIRNARRVEKEVSNNLDITLHVTNEHIEASFSVFYNKIDDYLFQQNTGFNFEDEHSHGHDEHEGEEEHEGEHMDEHEEEGIPIFIFRQQDAELYGFEAELDWHINDTFRVETFADVTRAELSDGQNVPRIPPLRIGAELHWENDNWHAELGATYNAKQDNIAEFETETDGYTLVYASFNYYMDVADNELVLFVRGNNLTDKEARVHASFIKDDAPLPGRSFVLGARMQF